MLEQTRTHDSDPGIARAGGVCVRARGGVCIDGHHVVARSSLGGATTPSMERASTATRLQHIAPAVRSDSEFIHSEEAAYGSREHIHFEEEATESSC